MLHLFWRLAECVTGWLFDGLRYLCLLSLALAQPMQGVFEGGERDGKAHIVRVDGRYDLSKGKALVDHRFHFWIDVGDYFCFGF